MLATLKCLSSLSFSHGGNNHKPPLCWMIVPDLLQYGWGSAVFSVIWTKELSQPNTLSPQKFKPKHLDISRIVAKIGWNILVCVWHQVSRKRWSSTKQSPPLNFSEFIQSNLESSYGHKQERKSHTHKSHKATHHHMIMVIQEFSINGFW